MKLHDLKPNKGAKKNRKRVGRGTAAGQGKTAGRGTKGQNSRAGGGTRLYFTGGNLPFYRRLPYMRGRGFTQIGRVTYHEINLDQLAGFSKGSEVTPESLHESLLIRDLRKPVVILGRGDVSTALQIRAHRVSAGARAKIEAAGGSVEIIEG
jgi:large subunit ribosomal protein L15